MAWSHPYLAILTSAQTPYKEANGTDTKTNIIVATVKEIVAKATVGTEPETVVLSPDGTRAYVPNETSHDVTIVDTATQKVLTSIKVGENPRGGDLAAHPASVSGLKARRLATHSYRASAPLAAKPLSFNRKKNSFSGRRFYFRQTSWGYWLDEIQRVEVWRTVARAVADASIGRSHVR